MLTEEGKVIIQNGGNSEPVKIMVHSADPVADATANRIGELQACAFDVATIEETDRFLTENVVTTIPTGDPQITTATHFSVYNSADVAIHIIPLTTPRSGLVAGDTVTLKTADTKLVIS